MNPNGGDKQVLNTGKNAPKHMNKFPDLKYKFACPERFGELSPCFMYNGLALDRNVTLHTGSSVDSMSLHAPILQDVKKNIDYYIVDKKAILPHTFEFIKNLPTHGDDIDASKANCLITPYTGNYDDIWGIISPFVVNSADGYFDADTFDDNQFNFFLRGLVIFNGLFSGDSLLESFRIPLARICASRKSVNSVLNIYWALYHHFLDKMGSYDKPDPTNIDFRDSDGDVVLRKSYFFNDIKDRMRFFYDYVENPYCTTDLASADWEEVITDVVLSDEYSAFATYFVQSTPNALKSAVMSNSNSLNPINIENVIAYQLICAEYHTNDKIDWIYSANMYRMLFEAYAFEKKLTYNYNGLTLPYDGFSAITLSKILNGFSASIDFTDATPITELNLIVSLLYRKLSLRYVDRFVGAKPLPLANGDSNIVVNDGVASVIDVTQKIQLMRFRMAVNRVGRKAKHYLRGIFNSEERVDVTCPVFVGHIDYMLYKNETQNTADSQLELDNSRTATINAGANKYGFSCDIDEDSLIIGISSYEITRFYDESLDPFAMKVDRYDMFNPFMQYTGDQAIPMNQLEAGLPADDIFGYETKDQEYKVATDYCIGDFRDSLSGWIFRQEHIDRDTYISPDFIRAHQFELDKYYLALTGTIPEKRYHFICKYSNYVTALRNMVKVPQILNA